MSELSLLMTVADRSRADELQAFFAEQRLPVLVTSTIITLPRVSLALQTCCFLWEFRLHQKNQNKKWTGRCRIISDLDTHRMK